MNDIKLPYGPTTIKECYEAAGSKFPFLIAWKGHSFPLAEYLMVGFIDNDSTKSYLFSQKNNSIVSNKSTFGKATPNCTLLDYFELDGITTGRVSANTVHTSMGAMPACNCKRSDFLHDSDCKYKKYQDANRRGVVL